MSGRATDPQLAELYRWLDNAPRGEQRTVVPPPGMAQVWQNRVTSRQQARRTRGQFAAPVKTWVRDDGRLSVYIELREDER